jgi:ribosomal protein S18 acetylase RimI-like enzyme
MDVNIKRVTRFSIRVFESLSGLLPQLDPNCSLPSKQDFEAILMSRNTFFLIAELDNGEIAGILTLVCHKILTGRKCLLEDVVVDESHRGKGIGKALIKYALAQSRSLGAGSVDLTSRPSRVAANKLYLDMGFVLRETNVYRYSFKE